MMIGERLATLRKDKGLIKKELSEKLFINYRIYSGYERNEIEASDDLKIKLAEFYNISVDYFWELVTIHILSVKVMIMSGFRQLYLKLGARSWNCSLTFLIAKEKNSACRINRRAHNFIFFIDIY
jgi:repressor LexA